MEQIYDFWVMQALALPALFLVGLLSVWAALGQGHWSWRALVPAGWFALSGLAGAHELAILFAAEFVTAFLLLRLRRRIGLRRARRDCAAEVAPYADRRGFQFSVSDILLLTALAAMPIPELLSLWRATLDHPLAYFCAGATCGWITVCATWAAVRGQIVANATNGFALSRPWLRWLLALFAMGAGGLALQSCYNCIWTPVSLGVPSSAPFDLVALFGLFLGCSILAWLTLGRRVSVRGQAHRQSGRWGQAALRFLRGAPIALALAVTLAVAWQIIRPVPTPPAPLGVENRARLVATIKKLDWSAIPDQDLDLASADATQAFAAANASTLAEARRMLLKSCGVKVSYDNESGWDDGTLMECRTLCRAFCAQIRAASARGDLDDAASAAVDCLNINLANRGGLLVHKLIAISHEGIAVAELAKIYADFDQDQCRRLIGRLDQYNAQREDALHASKHEYIWTMLVSRWFGRLQHLAAVLRNAKWDYYPFFSVVENADFRAIAQLRLLRAALALRGFELEHGRLATTLDELVPDWLDALPLDPFSDKPLIYQITDGDVLLYSVGPNLTDDGGQKVSSLRLTEGRADLFLDMYRLDELEMQASDAAANMEEQSSAIPEVETKEAPNQPPAP